MEDATIRALMETVLGMAESGKGKEGRIMGELMRVLGVGGPDELVPRVVSMLR